jgi:hypothetical protein
LSDIEFPVARLREHVRHVAVNDAHARIVEDAWVEVRERTAQEPLHLRHLLDHDDARLRRCHVEHAAHRRPEAQATHQHPPGRGDDARREPSESALCLERRAREQDDTTAHELDDAARAPSDDYASFANAAHSSMPSEVARCVGTGDYHRS